MKLSIEKIQLTSFLLFSLDTNENGYGNDYSVWYDYIGEGFEYLSHHSGGFFNYDTIEENFTKYQWNKVKNLFR